MDTGKYVLGTQISGADPDEWLPSMFSILNVIAIESGLTDYKVLILRLPDRKPLVTDDRVSEEKIWLAKAKEISSSGRLIVVYDRLRVRGEPSTLGWNKLQRYAFEDLEARVFVFVDPNLPDWHSNELNSVRDKLVDLVNESKTSDFVIGDYTPVVPNGAETALDRERGVTKKIVIEEGVKQMLGSQFPWVLGKWEKFRELRRPRSEFHALSKRLYKALKSYVPIPYDYGLQMLLVALVKDLTVSAIDIGQVPELYESGDPRIMMHQLRRVMYQLGELHDQLSGTR
jgi:hypothetical protein